MSAAVTHKSNKTELLIYLVNAILINNLLFFIDEGFQDFHWMSDMGNWVMLIVLTSALFGIQAFISLVLLQNFVSKNSRILLSIISINLTILVLVLSLFTKW